MLGRAEDPGPLQVVGAFAMGFIPALVAWLLVAATYEELRPRR